MEENNTEVDSSQLSESEKLTHELGLVKESVTQIKTAIKDFNDYSEALKQLRLKLDDEETGLQATYSGAVKVKGDIEDLLASANTNSETIASALTDAQSKLASVVEAHDNFVTKKAEIDHEETGFSALLAQSQEAKASIDALKKLADENVVNVKTALETAQEFVEEMRTTFADFTKTKESIDNEETGLEAVLAKSTELQQKISAVKTQSDALYQEIKGFRDESHDYNTATLTLKNEAEASTQAIKEFEGESQEYKEKIRQAYNISQDWSLANSFDARKTELKGSERFWFWTLIFSTLLLTAVVLWIYQTSVDNGQVQINSAFWYKVTFSSPVIFLVAFATQRYANERNLLERYAFKAATALSLESYTTLLKNTFKHENHEQRILNFVIGAMEMIYKEPFEQKTESKFSFGLNSKVGEVKTEVSTTSEEILTKPLEDIAVDAGNNLMETGIKKVTEQVTQTETTPA